MRYQKLFLGMFLGLGLGLLAGCEDETEPTPTTPAAPPAAQPKPVAQQAKPATSPTTTHSAKTAPESPVPAPGNTIEKADVGSGDKGRGYGQGVIATPIAAYFATRERITFAIQIPDCIRAYKFEHDFKGPKSHEEFMKEIIQKNGIQLPTLPPNHRYLYDPKTEELMVERPTE